MLNRGRHANVAVKAGNTAKEGAEMRIFVVAAWVTVLALLLGQPARAEDAVWIQIEARPAEAEALDRAHLWQREFPDLAGFVLPTGWHALAIGPFSRAEAEKRLAQMQGEGRVPHDSYLMRGAAYGARFWPPGVRAEAEAMLVASPPPRPSTPTAPTGPDSARRAESQLSLNERREVQTALAWLGLYDGMIDGAFGPGTRAALSAWQRANGEPETGALSPESRMALLTRHREQWDDLGMTDVTEGPSGIRITLPLGLVAFSGYEPPFVRYAGEKGVEVLLISAPGDPLTRTFEATETLALPGGRMNSFGPDGFTLSAKDDSRAAEGEARLDGDTVKGWIVVWPLAKDTEMQRVLAEMRRSFQPLPGRALDPTAGSMAEADRAALLAGVDIGRPTRRATGFRLDAAGRVATVTEAVAGCTRITAAAEATSPTAMVVEEQRGDLTILRPEGRAPSGPVARPAGVSAEPLGRGEIVAAGYGAVPGGAQAAILNGRYNGETDGRARLALRTTPEDAGGPVLDRTGGVLGMLLPATGPGAVARAIPARDLPLEGASPTVTLEPDALAALARAISLRIACWN